MKRGDADCRVSNMGLTFFKWHDNKFVHLLSNFHGTATSTVKRLQKDGRRIDVICPEIIRDYNQYMGGVDMADRLRQAYCVDRRAKKWWHRLFFGLLDIAFVNSYIVYKKLNPEEKVTLLDFRRGVSQGLMTYNFHAEIKNKARHALSNLRLTDNFGTNSPSPSSSNQSSRQNSPVPTKRRKYNYSVNDDIRLGNRGSHWPVFTKERRRCEQCSSKCVESRPHSRCSTCKVWLCVSEKKNCFAEYHNITL